MRRYEEPFHLIGISGYACKVVEYLETKNIHAGNSRSPTG